MSTDGLIVVGDRFEEFLTNRATIPASALLWRLRSGDLDAATPVLVGQGLTGLQLTKLANGNGRADGTDASDGTAGADGEADTAAWPGGLPTPVPKQLTHKRDGKNVMIGRPRRIGDDEFVADLVIDEHNEVLEDHLTGQHIPAIALMEAARQMWTVCTEEFLLTKPDPMRFVVITMGGQFQRYVFPLPTTLVFQVSSREKSPVGEVFRTRTTVRQNDAACAEIESEYRVVPEAFAAKQESMAARQAVKTCLAATTVLGQETTA